MWNDTFHRLEPRLRDSCRDLPSCMSVAPQVTQSWRLIKSLCSPHWREELSTILNSNGWKKKTELIAVIVGTFDFLCHFSLWSDGLPMPLFGLFLLFLAFVTCWKALWSTVGIKSLLWLLFMSYSLQNKTLSGCRRSPVRWRYPVLFPGVSPRSGQAHCCHHHSPSSSSPGRATDTSLSPHRASPRFPNMSSRCCDRSSFHVFATFGGLLSPTSTLPSPSREVCFNWLSSSYFCEVAMRR